MQVGPSNICMHFDNQRVILHIINLVIGKVKHVSPHVFHIFQEFVTCYLHTLSKLLKFKFFHRGMEKISHKGIAKMLPIDTPTSILIKL